MKLLKNVAGEFVVLIALFILALAVAKLCLHFYFNGHVTLTLYLDDEFVVFGLFKISTLLFILIAGLVYCIRFIFFKPRKLHLGILAVSFMLTAHFCTSFYALLYNEHHNLKAHLETSQMPEVISYNSLGHPMFDNDFSSAHDHWKEQNESFKKEFKWLRFGLAIVTLIQILLLMRCLRKKPEKEILSH